MRRPSRIRPLAVGLLNTSVQITVQWQNLLNDPFVMNAPRATVEGKSVPCIGGIPLLAKIGQGGMGAVYYGVHRGFAREVAVKILPFHLAETNPHLVNRFFREARVAAKVQSPHLVQVTDVAQEGNLSYLVMEFVSGRSAGALLKIACTGGAQGLDEETALEICIGACRGLADAHAANVIHRDIKPDNILVPILNSHEYDYANSKLADLGLARLDNGSHSMTNQDSCLGTPGYMAPEQIHDSRTGGKPADVFGLGATLYSMLCGMPPFIGETPVKAMMATIEEVHTPIRARADVTKATGELIDICLAKDPAHRYADGAALLKALLAAHKSLVDPQAVNYADINQARLDAELEEKKRKAAQAVQRPEVVGTANTAVNAKKSLWIAAALIAAVSIAGGIMLLNHDPLANVSKTRTDIKSAEAAEDPQDKADREVSEKRIKEAAQKSKNAEEFSELVGKIIQLPETDPSLPDLIKRAKSSPGYSLNPKMRELFDEKVRAYEAKNKK